METENTPRRIRLDLMSPVELAIYEVQQMVEKMPASIKLTLAGEKLSEARGLVADFIDGELDDPQKHSKNIMRTTNPKEEAAKDWFWKGRFLDRPMFHLRDGIYFVRENDRSVTVIKVQFFPETNSVLDTDCEWLPRIDFEFNVPTLEWCSVIAAVSKQGANMDSYEEAKKLHM